MANTQAVSTSFKQEILNGHHAFGTSVARGATTADTFKAALYLASGSQGAATTEVSGTGYTAGGVTFAWVAPTTSGTTAYSTPSASFAWTTVTLATAFDAVTLYNSTQSNKAVGTYTFGSTTVTAGNFTLTMPTNDSSTGLLRLT
jgi:hypothetical protein